MYIKYAAAEVLDILGTNKWAYLGQLNDKTVVLQEQRVSCMTKDCESATGKTKMSGKNVKNGKKRMAGLRTTNVGAHRELARH